MTDEDGDEDVDGHRDGDEDEDGDEDGHWNGDGREQSGEVDKLSHAGPGMGGAPTICLAGMLCALATCGAKPRCDCVCANATT